MKKILFSPVGGTDPITNQRDGAMLHICRNENPDEVYLYMSKEMCEFNDIDNRYSYCINKLGELLGHSFNVHTIRREELTEVHKFDYFYTDFNKCLSDIIHENEDSKVILNVSSGTPAMKSALQTMAAVSSNDVIPIQVSTPTKKINTKEEDRQEYDVELQWEFNEDNLEGQENRCSVSEYSNYIDEIKKGFIRTHITAYDYKAAIGVANTIKGKVSKDLITLLQVAHWRTQLKISAINKELQGSKYMIFPIREGDKQSIFEYILNMKIKVEKEEYADFIRALSPVISDLFELTIKNKCSIRIEDYCDTRKNEGYEHFVWNEKKLERNESLYVIIKRSPESRINGTPIYSSQLFTIVEQFCKDDHVMELCRTLRDVESTARNIAAHQIVSLDDSIIEKMTGKKSKSILEILRKLANQNGMKITNEAWESYEEMNDAIMQLIWKID